MKLKTFRLKRPSYTDFIRNDNRAIEQMKYLLLAKEVSSFYLCNGIQDYSYADINNSFTNSPSVDWAFEVYKMKKAILQNKKYTCNSKVVPELTKFANQIFLLAMAYSRADIVKYFLSSKIININCSIFAGSSYPSYFLFASSCSSDVFDLFKKESIKYKIGWCGLTPHLFSSFNSNIPEKREFMDFISYTQYQILLGYKGIKMKNSPKEFPIFSLDFACMQQNVSFVRSTLDAVPEAGTLSRISFLIQREENLYLLLCKYDFSTEQSFLGQTPLHLSCIANDLCAMTLLCYLGFPIVKNSEGKWPFELGNERTKEKSSIFFNICSTDIYNDKDQKIGKKFNHSIFKKKMAEWLSILKFKADEYTKYKGLFRYIEFNLEHKITSSSRFDIVNLWAFSKTPSKVEYMLKKLETTPYRINGYSDKEAVYRYSKAFK